MLLNAALYAAAVAAQVPNWALPAPNHTKPLGGFSMVPGAVHTEVYHGAETHGTYNHASMIGYFNATFIVAWKNGAYDEDKDGQRILFSSSTDGATWSKTDGTNVLFPSLSTKSRASAMFVGPPVTINGRLYWGASPGKPTGAAQGAQFCLWPDPVNPRNCGPPGGKKYKGILVMREVTAVAGGHDGLGPMFWASGEAPKDWAAAGKQYGIKSLSEMDPTTQRNIATLTADLPKLPCDPKQGTLKCEACRGGCQLYDRAVPKGGRLPQHPSDGASLIGNERAHYVVGHTADDVILYRSGMNPFLYASMRKAGGGQRDWGVPVETNIPNDESNLNTGSLPDGRTYLVNNAVYMPKATSPFSDTETLRFRDPVTIATSADGYTFDKAAAVISCTALPNNSTCTPRYHGGGKNPGPSYPQGLTVVAPAPVAHRGFYMTATNNKEDLWVTKIEFGSF